MEKDNKKKKTAAKQSTKKKTTEGKSATKNTGAKKVTTSKKEEKVPVKKEVKKVPIVEIKETVEVKEEKKVVERVELEKKPIGKIIFILALVVVFLGGMFALSEYAIDHSNDKKEVYQDANNPLLSAGEAIDASKMKEYKKITFDEFQSFLKEKKHVSVFVGTDSCSWCTYQKPVMKSVAYDYNITVYYLDLSTLNETQTKTFNELHEDLKKEYGTPMFFELNDGKVKDISHGAKNRADLIEVFKKQGFIES